MERGVLVWLINSICLFWHLNRSDHSFHSWWNVECFSNFYRYSWFEIKPRIYLYVLEFFVLYLLELNHRVPPQTCGRALKAYLKSFLTNALLSPCNFVVKWDNNVTWLKKAHGWTSSKRTESCIMSALSRLLFCCSKLMLAQLYPNLIKMCSLGTHDLKQKMNGMLSRGSASSWLPTDRFLYLTEVYAHAADLFYVCGFPN